MPFDAELQIRPTFGVGHCPIAAAPDPEPEMAEIDPGRLLAYLYVSPRPCPALDALLDV